LETKIAELNALNDTRQAVVAELSAAPQLSESAPGVGTNPGALTASARQSSDVRAVADDAPEHRLAPQPQSAVPQPPPDEQFDASFIDVHHHTNFFGAFCQHLSNKIPAPPLSCFSAALRLFLGQSASDALNHALNNTEPPAGSSITCSNGARSYVRIFDGTNPNLPLNGKYVFRVTTLQTSYDEAVELQQRFKAVGSILGQTDCLHLVMDARTPGLHVVVTLSSYYGRNAFDAVGPSELTRFLLHVRILLAESRLAHSDKSWKNLCWWNEKVVSIDHDETLVYDVIGKIAWLISAITLLFTPPKNAYFDTIHHDLLLVPIADLFRTGALTINPRNYDAGTHGGLVAPLMRRISAQLRSALTDAVNVNPRSVTIRSFLEQLVSINLEYIFKFIKQSRRPFHK
jgi:hypothetical protein